MKGSIGTSTGLVVSKQEMKRVYRQNRNATFRAQSKKNLPAIKSKPQQTIVVVSPLSSK